MGGSITRVAPRHRQRLHPQPRLSCPQPRPGLQIPTIAPMVLPIGWQVGRWARKLGVARCMARVAHSKGEGVVLRRHPMIATLDLQIGWRVGLWRRRRGVATIGVRVAPRQQEDVRDGGYQCFSSNLAYSSMASGRAKVLAY